MTNEVNNQLCGDADDGAIGGAKVSKITDHNWHEGQLRFKVLWTSEESTWETINDMKEDYPLLTANYIVDKNVTRATRGRDPTLSWAKKVVRDTDRAARRIRRLYDFYLDDNDTIYKVRRTGRNKKKKRSQTRKPEFKYGVQVPRNFEEAKLLDKQNGNTLWQTALETEIRTLLEMDCFDIKAQDFTVEEAYQWTRLHVVWGVKQDLRRKARLVGGGHLVDPMDHNVYSSTVKGISVRLLQVIGHKAKLDCLCECIYEGKNLDKSRARVWSKPTR